MDAVDFRCGTSSPTWFICGILMITYRPTAWNEGLSWLCSVVMKYVICQWKDWRKNARTVYVVDSRCRTSSPNWFICGILMIRYYTKWRIIMIIYHCDYLWAEVCKWPIEILKIKHVKCANVNCYTLSLLAMNSLTCTRFPLYFIL